jgi:hypothetical protein
MSTLKLQLPKGTVNPIEVNLVTPSSTGTVDPECVEDDEVDGDEEDTFPAQLTLTLNELAQLTLLNQRVSVLLNKEELINAAVVAGLAALSDPEHEIWARVEEKEKRDEVVAEAALALPVTTLRTLVDTLAFMLRRPSFEGEHTVNAYDFPSPRKALKAMRTLAATVPFVSSCRGRGYEYIGNKPGQLGIARAWLTRASAITGQSIG